MSKQTMGLDELVLENNAVVFIKANGDKVEMPNLTQLVLLYQKEKHSEVGGRIREILERGIGTLLVVEVMMDMTNETTLKRLETGEISKTMNHVNTYNIVLESHLEMAKEKFVGDFDTCVFAQFPYGIVIERKKYKEYKNVNYSVDAIGKILAE